MTEATAEPVTGVDAATTSNSALTNWAGIGAGVGQVLIAEWVGLGTPAGKVLVMMGPVVTHVSRNTFVWLQQWAEQFNERRETAAKATRAQAAVARARETLERELKNPHTSAEYKEKIRKDLEELNGTEVATLVRHAKVALGVAPPSSTSSQTNTA
ncbi:MAG: hypothetical protein HOW97_12885 [Catenulispora sp.]|nr:hypothetical protein [Catenulispora sp.]